MSNEEIVIRIQSGEDRDGELMAALWEQNWDFVAMFAQRYSYYAERDDLLQEGFIGLNNAVNHWHVDAGTKFLSYASFWIQQSMTRFIEKDSAYSVSMYQKTRKLRKLRTEYEQEFGRQPTETEICQLLGVTKKELNSIERAAIFGETASLDSPIGEDDEASLGDLTPAEGDLEASVIDEVQREQLSGILWGMVDDLPGDMPQVIRERYQDEKSLADIGEDIGCTLQQASDLQRKALVEMRAPKRINKLRPFTDEYIQAKATEGNGIGSFNRTWTSSTERVALKLAEGGEDHDAKNI